MADFGSASLGGADLGGSVGTVEGGGGQGREPYGSSKGTAPKKKRPPTETILTPEGTIKQALPKAAAVAPTPAMAAPVAATTKAPALDWMSVAPPTLPRRTYQATSAPLEARRAAARTVATGYGF